jgi:hypothetical protein
MSSSSSKEQETRTSLSYVQAPEQQRRTQSASTSSSRTQQRSNPSWGAELYSQQQGSLKPKKVSEELCDEQGVRIFCSRQRHRLAPLIS